MAQFKSSTQIEQYGLVWPNQIQPIAMEMEMIKHGGRWLYKSGSKAEPRMVGEGLFYHYRKFQELLWPEKIWHKWTILELEQYLENRIIGELGPASSGKTFSAATNSLSDYYVFSDCTTVLVSSTTRESLEMRVWGEIKKYHRMAKSRFPWLPGNLIEGRQRIVTDHRSEAIEGRDFRNGICFPVGTLVDTPTGRKPIEQIKVGDSVLNAAGVGTVEATHIRRANSLVRVTLEDSRIVDCTHEHPFFTKRGWVKAVDLKTSDMVFSARETLSLLQEAAAPRVPQQEVLQCRVQRPFTPEKVPSMPSIIPALEPEGLVVGQDCGNLLFTRLFGQVGRSTQALQLGPDENLRTLRKANEASPLREKVLQPSMPDEDDHSAMRALRPSVQVDSGISSQAENSVLRKILQDELSGEHQLQESGETNERRVGALEPVSRISAPLPFANRPKNFPWSPSLVSDRLGFPRDKACGGSGRRHPFDSRQSRSRFEARSGIKGTRVANVTLLDPTCDPRSDQGGVGYQVYNLSVTGHPSYSVNGVIVHNCGVACKKGGAYQGLAEYVGCKNKRVRLLADELHFMPIAFVDSISNLNKNADFKCIGLGNPKDITDALGKLCEPAADLGGWDGGIDQTPGTKTWRTKFPHGVCIQLPGSDSPNLDGKLECPLISQEKIDADIAFYGKDSLQYTMMDEGRMPRGMGNKRVITRQMCLKFQAMEAPLWRGDTVITKIGFLDAAYRGVGGDRCIFGELDFGADVTGRQILALIETMVVPIVDSNNLQTYGDLPEDQIANFCKTQCEMRGIVPQNFGFDSTGRGSLMAAFARLWSAHVIPVEFGGSPSNRPVAGNIDITCDKYYFNFVSELWFSSRLVIESRQFRGMTEDVMSEGCYREWGIVGKNKIQVEPKDQMKLKTSRSPDLYDGLVTGIEVARRRGFKIEKLTSGEGQRENEKWKSELRDKARKLAQTGQLTYR